MAAQITSPEPLLVQLGLDATEPGRLVHVPHEVPLNSLTINVLFPLRTAHTALPLGTKAQEGLPMPVALPVEVKLLQEAHADGHNASRVNKLILAIRLIILDFMLSPVVCCPRKMRACFSASLK
jgi:hypothetical protein